MIIGYCGLELNVPILKSNYSAICLYFIFTHHISRSRRRRFRSRSPRHPRRDREGGWRSHSPGSPLCDDLIEIRSRRAEREAAGIFWDPPDPLSSGYKKKLLKYIDYQRRCDQRDWDRYWERRDRRGRCAVKKEMQSDKVKVEPKVEKNVHPWVKEIQALCTKSESASSTLDINMNAEPESKLNSLIESDAGAPKCDDALISNNNDDTKLKKIAKEEEDPCKVLKEEEVLDETEASSAAAAGGEGSAGDGAGRMEAAFARRLHDVGSMGEAEAEDAAGKMMTAWADAGESYETLKRRYQEQRAGRTGQEENILLVHLIPH